MTPKGPYFFTPAGGKAQGSGGREPPPSSLGTALSFCGQSPGHPQRVCVQRRPPPSLTGDFPPPSTTADPPSPSALRVKGTAGSLPDEEQRRQNTTAGVLPFLQNLSVRTGGERPQHRSKKCTRWTLEYFKLSLSSGFYLAFLHALLLKMSKELFLQECKSAIRTTQK